MDRETAQLFLKQLELEDNLKNLKKELAENSKKIDDKKSEFENFCS